MKQLLIIFAGLICVLSAHAASFDCAKAGTKVEKLICADAGLSKLDDELDRAYMGALKDTSKVDAVKQAQKQWLKVRNDCEDAECIQDEYRKRISKLTAIEIRPPLQSGSWSYRDGAGRYEPLCHELLKRLNRYDRDESLDNSCSLPVLTSYPKFSTPPWEELDLQKHAELLFKLMKYSNEGPDGYFHLLPGLKERGTDSGYRYRAKLFIEDGGRLRMWRTRIFNHYESAYAIPAPPGEQVIVQMYIPMTKAQQATYCVGKPKSSSAFIMSELLFIVLPDLSGPDPNVPPGTFGILGGRDLLMYAGKPILVSSEDVWRDGQLGIDRVCNFEFVKREK